jgi:hypothetical protein
MKNRLIVGLGLVLISALGGGVVFGQETPERLTVTLDKPVHFLAPDGADKVVSPGEYTAKTHGEKSIELTATRGGEATTIQAEAGTHEQQLSVPIPVVVASADDVIHLVLLMPSGTTLDAVGTLSGVRTRGPMFAPLPPQQLAGAMTMQQQRFGRTPAGGEVPGGGVVLGGGVIPGGPQLGTQLPPQLQTQPGLQKTAPPLTQSGPQVDPCVQLVQAGGVHIALKAEATSPRSVSLSWSGPAGNYDLSTTTPGFGSSVQLGFATFKKPSQVQIAPSGTAGQQPEVFNGTVAHTSAVPGTRYVYLISGTLSDGRKVCGGAEATTPMELTVMPVNPLLLSRWTLRPESPPSIGPNSKVLIFIHGMDSRAEEADGFTKALFNAPRPGFAPPPLAPISASLYTRNFTSPDTCKPMDDFSGGQRRGVLSETYFAPRTPPQLLDMSPPPGTPIQPGAVINVPAGHNIGFHEGRLIPQLRAIAAAAKPLDMLRMAAADFASGNTVMGNALADLAVTGSRSFAAFRQALPGEPFCQSLGASNIQNGCRTALDRAYRVANFLRTGQRGDTPALKDAKMLERNALGWIAVSGEDDLPHRPVNVPSSDFPQYDLYVNVPTPLGPTPMQVVHTRFTIAQSHTPGNNLVVIAMDLPTSGYAGNLDYNLISPLGIIGGPKKTLGVDDFHYSGVTPLLDFIELFIVNFSEELHKTVPIKSIVKAVMGGSLGGNMTFRLGRRTDTPWLGKFVVWSPASIWDSLGWGSDPIKHQGPLRAWQSANQAMGAPGIGDRAAFFASWDQPVFSIIVPIIPAQSDTWASDFYPCKKSSVAGGRLDRQETYDAMFLAWHWRLAAEQLLFSHQTRDSSGQPLFMKNTKPTLLVCGVLDEVPGNNICSATQKTAQVMTATPGRAWFLGQTGHSVHDERHSFFALEVIQFLGL